MAFSVGMMEDGPAHRIKHPPLLALKIHLVDGMQQPTNSGITSLALLFVRLLSGGGHLTPQRVSPGQNISAEMAKCGALSDLGRGRITVTATNDP